MPFDVDSHALMRAVIEIEIILIIICALVLLGVGGRTQKAITRDRDRRRIVMAAISRYFDDNEPAPALTALRTFEPDERATLLVDIARSLHGREFDMLCELAKTLGTLQQAERDCADARWWKRLHGARLLTVLGGGEGVLPRMFEDPNALVRAQIAEWACTAPNRARINRLCAMLDDPVKLCRHTAADSLLRVGADVVPVLADHLRELSDDEALPALRIAVELSDARFLPIAHRLADTPSAEVRAVAARLLGRLGGEESSLRLVTLLDDDDVEVRAAACAALGELGYWPAAAKIAEQLRHPTWIVRRTAAGALRRIGNVGVLLLRHAMQGEDRYAADAARQVLDLPEMAAYE